MRLKGRLHQAHDAGGSKLVVWRQAGPFLYNHREESTVTEVLSLARYLPLLSTLTAWSFAVILFLHWRHKPGRTHLLFWFVGMVAYGIGSFAEALTAFGPWNDVLLKTWYIAGALLGAAPLAQGSIYLHFKKKTANIMAVCAGAFALVAALCVSLSPVSLLADHTRLTGIGTFEWTWVRLFSPFLNSYAVVFLVGGAAWSALQFARKKDAPNRLAGNLLITAGALLPAIGGSLARFGLTGLLALTELLGILLIWGGYTLMVRSPRAPR